MPKSILQRHAKKFELFDGLFLGNTVLERGLVLAPVIVAAYNYQYSLILGIAFCLITFFTVLISSYIPKVIPYTIRTILYVVIACGIFVPTAMYLDSLFPETAFGLGVFLPLLVVNSLIVVKSESRFHKKTKGGMILDLFFHCAGFFAVIMLTGIIREFLGAGSFLGKPVQDVIKAQAVFLPFSGFIIVGFLAAILKRIRIKLSTPPKEATEDEE